MLVALALLGGCASVPEARFDPLTRSGAFETRAYHPRILAQTVVEAGYQDAPNIGFRRLADYIFGKNATAASIEMTAPVDTTVQPAATAASSTIEMTAPVEIATAESARESYVITFTMPEQYTLATLPKPLDPQIRIVEVPAKTYAVVRFSGLTDAATVKAQTSALRDFIEKSHLSPATTAPILARYDPPWVLPWFRRNEILIEIKRP
ncbi:MAG TPA: heme-binding protein [Phycisphaerae bacterium]|jgi:hypothetical protein|nr:heme-binding protein [Phycisphaerae bacterium]